MKPLQCACLVNVQDQTLLLVRVRNNQHWYLPGGKIEPDESPEHALYRELAEELGIAAAKAHYLYSVTAPAYGQPGDVELICYDAEWQGVPRALGEISEVAWLPLQNLDQFAPAVQILCKQHLLPQNTACSPDFYSISKHAKPHLSPL
jgi:8-oxo-dGTP diphosphatase